MSDLSRRILFALLLAPGCAIAGGLLGLSYYGLTGPHPAGDPFPGLTQIAAGVAAGLLAGGFMGCCVFGPRGVQPGVRVVAVLVAIAAATTIVGGLSYIGSLTNAGGPESIGPYFGILLVPAGIVVLVVVARWLSRSRHEGMR